MTEEKHVEFPPCCSAKWCEETFGGYEIGGPTPEGRVLMPDDWVSMEVSFVTTIYDKTRTPTELVPMRGTIYFCPDHATKLEGVEDIKAVMEPTPQGGFTFVLDND